MAATGVIPGVGREVLEKRGAEEPSRCRAAVRDVEVVVQTRNPATVELLVTTQYFVLAVSVVLAGAVKMLTTLFTTVAGLVRVATRVSGAPMPLPVFE